MKKTVFFIFLVKYLMLTTISFGQFHNVFNVPNINTVYALETNDSIVFAGTGGSGVFRSDDNGNTWIDINNEIQPWYYYSLLSFNDSLFAGSFGYVHLSSDNGDSWKDMNIGLQLNDYIYALERKEQYLHVGVKNKGVYSCLLSSGNWSISNNGFHIDPTVNDLLAIGTDIYAATDSGFYKSSDNAATWVLKNNGLSSQLEVNKVFNFNAMLFAGTSNGLYKSVDWGDTWVFSNSGLPSGSNVRSFAEMNDSIFLGTYSSLYTSSDLGNSWTPFNTGLPGVCSVYSMTTRYNSLFAGSGGVIYLYTGASLSTEPFGNYNQKNISVFPNPTNDCLIFQFSNKIQDKINIQIFDQSGSLITNTYNETNPAKNVKIDLTELNAGIYFYKITTQTNYYSGKFIKTAN